MTREISGITSRQSKTSQNIRGFTLIEVVVVMAIIAVLASLVVGAIRVARNMARETTHRSNAKTIQTALEAKYARDKKYNGDSGKEWYDFGNARTGYDGAYPLFSETISFAATPECFSGEPWTHNSPPSPYIHYGLYAGGLLQVKQDSYTIYIANADCTDTLTETISSQ